MKNLILNSLLFFQFSLFQLQSYAQEWEWAKKGGGTKLDVVYDIKLDNLGNVYVTGFFYSPALFGNTLLSNTSVNGEVFLIKYDNNGNVLWAKQGGGNGSAGYSIVIDNSGNCYLIGSFFNTATFGGYNLISAGSNDIFIVKYNSNGSVLSASRAGSSGEDSG